MPELLHCPSCNAGLDYAKDSPPTIRCSYCGSSVVVPEHLREKPRQPELDSIFPAINIEISHQSEGRTVSGWLVVALIIVVFVAIGGIIWFADNVRVGIVQATGTAIAAQIATRIAREEAQVSTSVAVLVTDTPQPTPASADLILQFGEKGTGRGQFERAQWLTLDNDGHIYVLDRANNRVQVFNEAGEYQTQWLLSSPLTPTHISADRQKRLYVLDSLSLVRYDGFNGVRTEDWDFALQLPFFNFYAMAFTSKQELLLSYWDGSKDFIITLDQDGAIIASWEDPVNNHMEMDAVAKALAKDLNGNIYAFENEAILKFSPEGRFLNRVGGRGTGLGEWSAPRNIGVDGHGRLYVAEWQGIHVYDNNGRFLETISTDGFVIDLAISDNNEIWVIIDSVRIAKYVSPQ
jgi:hypothetical protein